MNESEDRFQQAFDSYLGAFAKGSPAEQEELLRAGVADDVRFTNPGVSGHGRDDLLRHVGMFREHFPGHRFALRWLRRQNGQALVEWAQLDGDGAEFMTGHSFARLDDGRLDLIAGFWAPGPLDAPA